MSHAHVTLATGSPAPGAAPSLPALEGSGSEHLLAAHRVISNQLAESPAPGRLLPALLAGLGEALRFSFAIAWQPDPDQTMLRCAAVWQRPGVALAAFHAAALDHELSPGEELAGRVWIERQPLGVADLRREAKLSRRAHAERAGLRSALAFPLMSNRSVEGVVELFAREFRPREPELEATLADCGAAVGRYIARWRERHRLELVELEEVFGALQEGVFIQDPRGRIVACNASAERLTGLPADALVGRLPELPALRLEREGGDLDAGVTPWSETLESGRPSREVVMTLARPDGKEIWVSVNCQPLKRMGEPSARGVVTSFTDITDRREAEREIKRLAYHDRLTGLPNRALLDEHLKLAIARADRTKRSIGVLYIDLDDFKAVNDTRGHAAGDQLLQEVAARLATVTRATDLLARHGGDEFLLLLTDLEREPEHVLELVAEKIERSIREPFEIEGATVRIGASVGASLYPRDGADVTAVVASADAAMYRQKSRRPASGS
jgi:diguanylate cyclase (GGDEF)-like protein/PAS domain S-box-containing protein